MAKIMLVEDDKNLQSIYGDRLKAEGHSIITADDGEEALAIAVKERPDLIISDVMMPKISGFDMLDILRSTPETKDVKIIMMTALSQAEDKQRADKLGADRYLVKSQVTLDDVARTVNEIVRNVAAKPAEAAASQPSPAPAPTDNPAVAAPSTPVVIDDSTVATPPDSSDNSSPSEPVKLPDPVVVPVQEPPTPPPASPPAEPVEVAKPEVTADEQAEISSQIEDFLAKNLPDTPTHAEPAVTPASQPPAAPVTSKKVIEPLSTGTPKPDIMELYEMEMSKENNGDSQPAAGSVVESTSPPQAASTSPMDLESPPQPAAQPVDQPPVEMPAEPVAGPPELKTSEPVEPPTPPTPSPAGPIDPHSMAL